MTLLDDIDNGARVGTDVTARGAIRVLVGALCWIIGVTAFVNALLLTLALWVWR